MIDTQTLNLLAGYNAWADRTLFEALAKLPEESIYRETRTLFKSMIGTLNHNYQVDLIWQAHLCGRQHGFTSRRDMLYPRLEGLVRAQSEADQWLVDWAKSQDGESLSEAINFRFTSGNPGQMQRGAMFLHVINHKTYHRGWVSQMFFEDGAKPPETDLSVYLTGHE
ncbi:MAG TPA: DinB family protein [Burkholderiales bacterium]|nr:DinB family protein [Burkholderiales bacterium]